MGNTVCVGGGVMRYLDENLQKKMSRYLAGICIFILILGTVVLWNQNEKAIVEDVQKNLLSEAVLETLPETINLETMEEAITPDIEELPIVEEQIVDPLQLSGYQAPSNGVLQYHYGIGYDCVCDDYRFYNDVCYTVEDGTVYACIDGTVSVVWANQTLEVTIYYEDGKVQYRGLSQCSLSNGDPVMAGEQIGVAEEVIYIQAVNYTK